MVSIVACYTLKSPEKYVKRFTLPHFYYAAKQGLIVLFHMIYFKNFFFLTILTNNKRRLKHFLFDIIRGYNFDIIGCSESAGTPLNNF